MSTEVERVCDAGQTAGLIKAVAEGIWDGSPAADSPVRLIGVRSQGVPLAERLAAEAVSLGLEPPAVGAVDITLYRDDLDDSPRWPVLRGTEIPFDVNGADIVLVDDVIYTGRTIRAAINAVCDLGRPSRVRLAVLVDRGWRELPIQPDVVGLTLKTHRSDRVEVRLRPRDAVEEIVRTPAPRRASTS